MATQPVTPQARIGKTAVLLHFLGLGFLLVAVGVMAVLGTEIRDTYIVLGVGIAACLVLLLWSIVLAIRSYKRRESPRFRLSLLFILLVEISGASLLLWIFEYQRWAIWWGNEWSLWLINLSFSYCVPAITSFGLVLFCITLAVRKWKGLQGLSLPRFILVFILAAFPPVLILYCLLTIPGTHTKDARTFIASAAPTVVVDSIEGILADIPASRTLEIRCAILSNGLNSKDKLRARIDDKNWAVASAALTAFDKRYPQESVEIVKPWGEAQPLTPNSSARAWSAAQILADRLNPEQKRHILDQGKAYTARFRLCFLYRLVPTNQRDYVEDLLRFGAEELTEAPSIFEMTYDTQSEERAWLNLLARKDWPDRKNLVQLLGTAQTFFSPVSRNPAIVDAFMSDSDLEIRRGAAVAFYSDREISIVNCGDHSARVTWLQRMLKPIDNTDLFVRRAAILGIAEFLGLKVSATLDERQMLDTPNWIPAAAVPGEADELEKIRAEATQWIEKNKQ